MSLCILTTTAALFPPASPKSGRHIRTMTLAANHHGITPPTIQDYLHTFAELESEFTSILILAASDAILPGVENAQNASYNYTGKAKIEILDTQQIGPGLGILTQLGARKAASGVSLPELAGYLRTIIPYLFTIICPGKFPFRLGVNSSLITGPDNEQPGPMAVYSLEEGLLTHYKNVRTQRHLLETFLEFLEEFENPQQFACFHGKNAGIHIQPLRETTENLFPGIHFIDLGLNPAVSEIFGEQAVGLTVLELPRESGL